MKLKLELIINAETNISDKSFIDYHRWKCADAKNTNTSMVLGGDENARWRSVELSPD